MKADERPFVFLVVASILIAGCASQPPRPAEALVTPELVSDQPVYELTARLFSPVGGLYMEVTTLVATDKAFSVHATDGVGRSVLLSGRMRESDGRVFQFAGFSFVAHAPAQEGSASEAFDMLVKAELELKLDELYGGGAIHGPRYEFILRKAQRDGQSGRREDCSPQLPHHRTCGSASGGSGQSAATKQHSSFPATYA